MEKKLYGGDAKKIKELSWGDEMNVDLIDEAITMLLPKAYISKKRIKVLLTFKQLAQIKPNKNELTAMIYFMPIETYSSNKKIQVAYISNGEDLIKIYTTRE